MRRLLAAVAALSLPLLPAPARATADPRQVAVTLTKVWGGLDDPVALTYAPGETSRMFVVERAGRVRVIRNGVLKAAPYLDLSSRVNTSGEGGLLGLAFRPDFRTTGFLYVTWTDSSMTLHVSRYRANPNSDTVSTSTGSGVLLVPHPGQTNHNGGQLAFGPGGLLYVGTGDGGGGGDPAGNAQNAASLLGKVLRIDVVHTSPGHPYAIPKGNPYTYSTGGQRKEIWLLGLRNPWRFSFDRGRPYDLWVGDVGQADREEVDRLTKGGLNLGWDCREGTLDTASQYGGSYCRTTGYTAPLYEYDHSLGCAIIGGYVYRGQRYASLLGGTYVYADYCSGRVWGLGYDSAGRRVNAQLGTFSGQVLAFGEAPNGEQYLLGADGGVYRLAAAAR